MTEDYKITPLISQPSVQYIIELLDQWNAGSEEARDLLRGLLDWREGEEPSFGEMLAACYERHMMEKIRRIPASAL